MLNIFYARESIDKEKFIYERIKTAMMSGQRRRFFVIVPDQYTLEAEKRAFHLLDAQGLMDVEIISMSRLGSRLLSQQGGSRNTFIDKYGRHVLLAQVLADKEGDLQIFAGSRRRNSFIEMTNNFISEMKQYNIAPEQLSALSKSLPENSLLSKKLADLQVIFEEYQRRIEGKYTDSEDLIDLYTAQISASPMLRGCGIWVYGFDSFAPKAMDVLGRLMATAAEMNVFLTYDQDCRDEEIFQLTGMVKSALIRQARSFDVPWKEQRVFAEQYRAEKRSAVFETLERELYAVGRRSFLECPQGRDGAGGIWLCQAANGYSEAESAAAFILYLLRDKGFRYRDLVVICNDQEVRGSVIRRVFEECGIRFFDDQTRTIMHSPIALFAVALLETVAGGYRTQDVFRTLKAGFSPLTDDEIESLENYVIKYRIKGSMWKKPFVKGQMEYGDDGLTELEELRQRVMKLFGRLEAVYRACNTTGEFIESYYDFLIEDAHLGEAVADLAVRQREQGFLDLAEETLQIWGKLIGLLDQMTELMGEQFFDGKAFTELLVTGLSQLEVGVLPPTPDDILMGTMQRTRSGSVRAVIVIGANEGLLPAAPSDEGLFSVDELEFLASEGAEICKVDHIRVLEEKLAIYRNLCKPSDYLWVSYAASDSEGKESRPSEIVDSLLAIFPQLPVVPDVVSRGDIRGLVSGRISALRHLMQALQQGRRGEKINGSWRAVIDWYCQNDREALQMTASGLEFTNEQRELPRRLAESLYKKEGERDLSLSPSRLERFSRCPFAHFVAYGLRPEERRVFEAAGREIGDIYHRCLMEVSRKLTKEDSWQTVTEAQCRTYVEEIAKTEAAVYREGVFHFGNEEQYKVRRIEDTCFHVCWALIEQVRAGRIRESRYEESFGRGKRIPAVEVVLENGERVYVEGKIDRLDILEDDRIKIIDYKTGKENFKISEARGGYRLQLMLYLKAAQENAHRPAGVFYFLIDDHRVDLTGAEKEKISEKISKEMRKSYRLNGIMVNDGDVIDSIAGEFDGYSDIVPLRNSKEGIKATSEGFLLSDEEFDILQGEIDQQIRKLCGHLAEGKIAITPKKTDRESPCTYCRYKGICRFDLDFPGCNYEIIK